MPDTFELCEKVWYGREVATYIGKHDSKPYHLIQRKSDGWNLDENPLMTPNLKNKCIVAGMVTHLYWVRGDMRKIP